MHSTAYRSPEAIPDGPGARRRRWQHRLSDRRGALGLARGASVDRLAPDAAAAAHPRPRPVLVSREDGADPQVDGVADRPATCGARHADRLEPPDVAPTARRPAPRRAVDAAGSTVSFADGTELDVGVGHLGDRLPGRSLVDRRARCSTLTAALVHERGVTEVARPLLPRAELAAHQGLGAARLGQGRRRVHRATDQRLSAYGAERGTRRARRTLTSPGEPHEHHLHTTSRPTATGLPERTADPSWSSLADGDEFDLRIAPVAKRLGDDDRADAGLQRLDPGPDAQGAGRARRSSSTSRTRATWRPPSTGTGCGSRTATTEPTRPKPRCWSASASRPA